jgi:hypothetical protein
MRFTPALPREALMKDIFTGSRRADGRDRKADDLPGDLARAKGVTSQPRPRFAPPDTSGRDRAPDLPADPDDMWENMPV